MSTNTIFVRTSTTSATGYELVTKDELGNESVQAIESTYKNEPYTLILPENESGRKYLNSKKVDAADGELELIAINRTSENTHKLSSIKIPKSHEELYEHLTDEEMGFVKGLEDAIDAYMGVLENAWARLHPKKEALTEEQKLRNRLAKLQAQLDEMMKNDEDQA